MSDQTEDQRPLAAKVDELVTRVEQAVSGLGDKLDQALASVNAKLDQVIATRSGGQTSSPEAPAASETPATSEAPEQPIPEASQTAKPKPA